MRKKKNLILASGKKLFFENLVNPLLTRSFTFLLGKTTFSPTHVLPHRSLPARLPTLAVRSYLFINLCIYCVNPVSLVTRWAVCGNATG